MLLTSGMGCNLEFDVARFLDIIVPGSNLRPEVIVLGILITLRTLADTPLDSIQRTSRGCHLLNDTYLSPGPLAFQMENLL